MPKKQLVDFDFDAFDRDTASGYYIRVKRNWQSYLDGSHCRIIGNIHEQEK